MERYYKRTCIDGNNFNSVYKQKETAEGTQQLH